MQPMNGRRRSETHVSHFLGWGIKWQLTLIYCFKNQQNCNLLPSRINQLVWIFAWEAADCGDLSSGNGNGALFLSLANFIHSLDSFDVSNNYLAHVTAADENQIEIDSNRIESNQIEEEKKEGEAIKMCGREEVIVLRARPLNANEGDWDWSERNPPRQFVNGWLLPYSGRVALNKYTTLTAVYIPRERWRVVSDDRWAKKQKHKKINKWK